LLVIEETVGLAVMIEDMTVGMTVTVTVGMTVVIVEIEMTEGLIEI
jgi:hypothetical protein